jgi:3D (Asp-Asp-Asp) domain-containing protein
MRANGIFFLAAAMMAVPAFAGQSDDAIERTVVETKKFPHKVVYEVSRLVGPGRIVKAQEGKDGVAKYEYRVLVKNGKEISRELVSKTYDAPEDTVFHMGKAGYENVSRHRFSRTKVLTMRASAYDTSPRTLPGSSGRGALGMYVKYGHVAVDPRVIKLGTIVFVEGYGLAIASDTGGAIKGNRIDLCMNSRAQALRFGRKTVKVHVLGSV